MNSTAKKRGGAYGGLQAQIDDIVVYFNQNCPNLSVNRTDLSKPADATDQLGKMYNFLVMKIYEADLRAFEQMPFHPTKPLDGELFGCGYAKIMLCAAINEYLPNIDSKMAFTIQDLISPTAGRTVRVMNLLIEIAKFTELNGRTVTQMLNDFENAKFERQHLRDNVDRLKANINETKMKKQTEKNRAKAATINANVEKLEKEKESNEASMEKIQQDLRRLQVDEEYLDKNIVTSPERMRGEVETIRSQRSMLLRQIDEVNADVDAIRQRKKILVGTVTDKIEILQAELAQLQHTKELIDDKRRQLDDQRQELTVVKRRITDDLEREIQQFENLLATKQQSIEKIEAHHEQNMLTANKKLDAIQQLVEVIIQLDQLEAKQNQNVVVADDLERDIEAVKRDIEECTKEKQRFHRGFLDQQNQILEKTMEFSAASKHYFEQLAQPLDSNALELTFDKSHLP